MKSWSVHIISFLLASFVVFEWYILKTSLRTITVHKYIHVLVCTHTHYVDTPLVVLGERVWVYIERKGWPVYMVGLFAMTSMI